MSAGYYIDTLTLHRQERPVISSPFKWPFFSLTLLYLVVPTFSFLLNDPSQLASFTVCSFSFIRLSNEEMKPIGDSAGYHTEWDPFGKFISVDQINPGHRWHRNRRLTERWFDHIIEYLGRSAIRRTVSITQRNIHHGKEKQMGVQTRSDWLSKVSMFV